MGRSVPDEPTSAEIADLVGALSRRIRHRAHRDLDPFGVTWSQMRALRTIARHDGPVRMSELADRLGIARRSATSVVDELVERGLVDRTADPADRRAVAVGVTPSGWQLLDDLAGHRRAAADELTAGLTNAELRSLRDLLRRLSGDDGTTLR